MEAKFKAYLLPFNISLPSEINLGEGFVIRKIKAEEIKEKKTQGLSFLRYFDLTSLGYCIEYIDPDYNRENKPIIIGKDTPHLYTEIEWKFNRVILALRLFKKGTIGYSEFDGYADSSWAFSHSEPASFNSNNPYVLFSSEVQDFILFYNKIKSLKDIDFTARAIERFGISYERQKQEDKLIDIFVALESLFGITEELSFRLSLSTSSYLYPLGKERKEAFDKIRKAYNIRSKVVHGSEVDYTELDQTTFYMEEYFREVIKKIMFGKQDKNRDYFLDYVKNKIFGL